MRPTQAHPSLALGGQLFGFTSCVEKVCISPVLLTQNRLAQGVAAVPLHDYTIFLVTCEVTTRPPLTWQRHSNLEPSPKNRVKGILKSPPFLLSNGPLKTWQMVEARPLVDVMAARY